MEIVCPVWNHQKERFSKVIPLLADQGVTGIEIPLGSPDYFNHRDSKDVKLLMNSCKVSGIRITTIHSPFAQDCDISSLDDQIHENGVSSLLESIEFANIVDCDKIIVHASDKVVDNRQKRLNRAKGVLKEMSIVALESNVNLAIENLPPEYLCNTYQEILSIIKHIKSSAVSVCFDCGHANMQGLFAENAQQLLPHSSVIHVHDNDGSEDKHLFPGKGNIDWKSFWKEYKRIDCGASISLECLPQPEESWMDAFQNIRYIFGA